MFAVYRTASEQDILRIIDYCRAHNVNSGGLFEVYPGPADNHYTVIVNSHPAPEHPDRFKPLGAFYCNHVAPGVISIEEDDPDYDGVASRKEHIRAIKQVIDHLLTDGFPGSSLPPELFSILTE